MATAPVQLDEESLIRGFVEQMTLPAGVKLDRIEQTIDSSGEAALRIYFAVDISKKYPVTPRRIAALNELTSLISEKVFSARIEKWPYFTFLEVK